MYKKTGFSISLALCILMTVYGQQKPNTENIKDKPNSTKNKYSSYLFVYFTASNKDDEQIRFAWSDDGYNFKALNHNQPILSSGKISESGGVRDPHIMRAIDGKTFYMVATDMVAAKGWDSNRGMVLLKSTNLIDWKSSIVNVSNTFSAFKSINRAWAPQTIYDPVKKKYMIYWSMRSGNEPDKIYYAYANKDFTALETEPKQLFFEPKNKACIDGDIIFYEGKYHLFYKDEGNLNGIKKAVSDKLTEGYVAQDKPLQQTTESVEGSCVFKLNNSNSWILMYDVYRKGKYQFTKSDDLENFKVIDQEVTMDFHPRHGTVMSITDKEAKRLRKKWMMGAGTLNQTTQKK
jgi:arabinoxylan arabinofuranohydrolase